MIKLATTATATTVMMMETERLRRLATGGK
jgi:hypothetical protein